MSVPAQAPRSTPESTAPVSHPAPSSSPIADDAQAFLDAAFAGQITDEADSGAGAPDVGEATPTTPAPDGAVEAVAEVQDQQPPPPARQPGSRRDRERSARGETPSSEPEAPAAESPASPLPPQPTREEIIAEHERQQAEARDREAAQTRERQRFAAWTGEAPADPANPSGPTVYQQLLERASQEIGEIDYATDTDAYNARVRDVNAARARLNEINERRAMLDALRSPFEQASRQEALTWIGQRFEAGLADAGVDTQAILAAGRGHADPMTAIVKALATSLRTAIEGEYRPRIAELEEDASAKDSEIDALRRQLGGRAPQPVRGGTPVSSTAAPTLDALDALGTRVSMDDLSPYLDMLPPAPSRR